MYTSTNATIILDNQKDACTIDNSPAQVLRIGPYRTSTHDWIFPSPTTARKNTQSGFDSLTQTPPRLLSHPLKNPLARVFFVGCLQRIELWISVPQTEVLPLNYRHHMARPLQIRCRHNRIEQNSYTRFRP